MKNRLDPYAERLRQWDAEKKTLAEIVQLLKDDGCSSSKSSVQEYLERMRNADREEKEKALFFGHVSSGAAMNKELDAEFAKNPVPDIERLITVSRALNISLMARGSADPELMRLAISHQQIILNFVSGQTKAALKKEEIEINRGRLKLLEENAARAKQELQSALATRTDGGLSPEALKQIEQAANLL